MKSQFETKKTTKNGSLRFVLNNVQARLASTLILFSMLITLQVSASVGEDIFKSKCFTCHTATDKVIVGPGLGGVGERRSAEWLTKWIHNPQELIASGDADAVKVFEEYNKVPMPGFPDLTDADIKELIAFFGESAKAPAAATASSAAPTAGSSSATTPEAETGSSINGDIIFWGLISLTIVGFFLYRFKKRTFTFMNQNGYHAEPHSIPNYGLLFIVYALAGASIIYLFTYFLAQKESMVNSLMFVALPYLAFGIFLVGSIYRYKKRGYQVSSLSSQFLEGKKLFWGSQPFHWGLLVLFLGHLTAFLFPRAILAWNGEPVRLLILEISSFAFALSALFGLILLIKRRLSTRMVLVVTNKMDLVVYTILLTQIISGLGVAFFVRWGSSWFSSVLTPYLRSVFSFNPDITAVSEMPVLIQIHIISAFLIIAIIPFTRFMHFLVAPIDYIWRRYQVVIWNWNRKAIRTSTRHNFGKKSRNH